MRHLTILLGTLLLTLSSHVYAQEDDMYFSPKKAKKEQTVRKIEIVYDDDEDEEEYVPVSPRSYDRSQYAERDVDEYNRRGHSGKKSTNTVADSSDYDQDDTREARTYQLSSQNLYDLGYSEGYRQGFDDGEDLDYYYGIRLARFHGRHFFDPWYWGSITMVYDPWDWNPWYWDPWYRPYYHGGWCSVGWGVGHWGTYWDPYWHGWHHHHHHHHHWVGNYYTPRYSTVRNRDYGRTRIINRNRPLGNYRGNADRGNRNGLISRPGSGRTDRTSRFNNRLANRSYRALERAGSRNINRPSGGTINRGTARPSRGRINRTSTSRSDRYYNRSRDSYRSSSRSSSRVGSSSSSYPRSSGSVGGGHSRSTGGGGGRSGGGRGR